MELSDWLLCDRWTQNEAVLLLAGINPAGTSFSGKSTDEPDGLFSGPIACLDGSTLHIPSVFFPIVIDEQTTQFFLKISEEHNKIREKRLSLALNVCRILNLIERSLLLPNAAPKEYVEWAVSKGIDIPELLAQQFLTKMGDVKESPENRRRRLGDRVLQEKVKGNKAFLKIVANEEGISVSRLKQLIKSEPPPQSTWVGQLVSASRQTGSKKPKHKK
jgi:hypothetical protein